MSAMIAAYLNERDKILLRKKYIVFLIIGVVICVILAIGGVFASNAILRFGGLAINIAPSPMIVLPIFSQVIIPLLIFMASADLFTAETSNNTMKAMICRPVERWKLYSAKLLAIVTYAAIYLGVIFVISTVLNQLLGRSLGIGEIVSAFFSYLLTLFPLAVLVAFASLVALFGRSSSLTMFLLVIIYLVLNALPLIFPALFDMLFTSYLGWHRLWIGFLPEASRLIHALAIIGGYGVVFVTGGSLIFDRREY